MQSEIKKIMIYLLGIGYTLLGMRFPLYDQPQECVHYSQS